MGEVETGDYCAGNSGEGKVMGWNEERSEDRIGNE